MTSQHDAGVQRVLDRLLANRDFQTNIRRYNAAMAFASFGDASRSERQGAPGRGPPVFAVHGQVYHAISTLQPPEGKQPLYGQLYFYDPTEALQHRVDAFDGLDKSVLEDLHKMLIYDARGPFTRASRNN